MGLKIIWGSRYFFVFKFSISCNIRIFQFDNYKTNKAKNHLHPQPNPSLYVPDTSVGVVQPIFWGCNNDIVRLKDLILGFCNYILGSINRNGGVLETIRWFRDLKISFRNVKRAVLDLIIPLKRPKTGVSGFVVWFFLNLNIKISHFTSKIYYSDGGVSVVLEVLVKNCFSSVRLVSNPGDAVPAL